MAQVAALVHVRRVMRFDFTLAHWAFVATVDCFVPFGLRCVLHVSIISNMLLCVKHYFATIFCSGIGTHRNVPCRKCLTETVN